MKIQFAKGIYFHKRWYYYFKPKKITTFGFPKVYQWLFWIFIFEKKDWEYYRLKTQGQRTFVYCPICNEDLISSKSWIHNKSESYKKVCSSIYEGIDDRYEIYKCVKCNCYSVWDFDLPVPQLIQYTPNYSILDVDIEEMIENGQK